MSNLIGALLNSSMSNTMLEQMAGKSGLDVGSVGSIVSKVAPVLMQKANDNFKGTGDSSGLLDMISKTSLDSLSQNPSQLEDTDAGNALLGELTGSKEQSRALAGSVGSSLGINASSIIKLLPMIAPLVAGMLNKQTQTAGTNDTNALTSMLSSFIDQDNDGSIADDLLGMASKFFK